MRKAFHCDTKILNNYKEDDEKKNFRLSKRFKRNGNKIFLANIFSYSMKVINPVNLIAPT